MIKKREKVLITLSIFISIAIHVVAIGSINHLELKSFIATKNIVFTEDKKSTSSHLKKNPSEIISLVFKKNRKKIIKELKKNRTLPAAESLSKIIHTPTLRVIKKAEKQVDFVVIKDEKMIGLNESDLQLPSIDFAKNPTERLIDEIDTPLEITKTTPLSSEISVPENEKDKTLINKRYPLKDLNIDQLKKTIFFKELLEDDNFLINLLKQKKLTDFSTIFSSTPSFFDLPSLEDLSTMSYKDFFNIDIAFAPDENSDGFIFAITLIPKSNLKLTKFKQNIFFLVDKSNSIQKERLTSTRHAIVSSLNLLNKEDRFNILAFDKKLDVLSRKNLTPNNSSISRAKKFLINQNIGSFFSSTNLSIPLFKVLNNNVKDDEINIAILLSNGEGIHKFKNYQVINEWTKLNKGNLSLYTLSLHDDKNYPILELFSCLNKGKLLSSSTKRGIKRKLQRLIKSLNHPIAKNISSTAIFLDKKANIQLYPSMNQNPNLYLEEPFVIIGTADKLEDFTLFLQGKSAKGFFNLKKHISFDRAKQVGESLQRELAIKKASLCYEKYLTDNDPSHLDDAENHLQPFEIEPAFR